MLLDYIINNKNKILDIFEKYGATNVAIIGSVSKRRETNESDIDFVADFNKGNNNQPGLQIYSDLLKELKRYFSRKIDLASYEQIRFQYPKALQEGVSLNR